MGQQQLLLITIGVILIGIAITAGIAYYNQKSVDANRDAVIMDLNNLATEASAFFKKPKSLGGGGKSYVGFSIPALLDTTNNGHYNIISVSSSNISIKGTGVESAGSAIGCNSNSYKVQYTMNLDDSQNIAMTKDN